MRIAITGATGFLGRKLSQYLHISGYNVIEYVRSPINSNQVELNLSWRAIPTDYFKGIDVVIHCAASVHRKISSDELFYQNTTFTELLLDSAIEANVRGFYFMSTVGVFGKYSSKLPLSDFSQLNPLNDYSQSKLLAEILVAEKCIRNNMSFNIIRLPLIIGANAPGTFGSLLKIIDIGLPLPFKGITNRRSIIEIDFFSKWLVQMLKKDIYINGTGIMCQLPPVTIEELVLQGGKMSSKNVKVFKFPKLFFWLSLKILGQEKVYNQLFDSLEFVPHSTFKNVLLDQID